MRMVSQYSDVMATGVKLFELLWFASTNICNSIAYNNLFRCGNKGWDSIYFHCCIVGTFIHSHFQALICLRQFFSTLLSTLRQKCDLQLTELVFGRDIHQHKKPSAFLSKITQHIPFVTHSQRPTNVRSVLIARNTVEWSTKLAAARHVFPE